MVREIDTHVHTKRFSGDSMLDIREVLERAHGRGVCITEHMDFGRYVKNGKKFDVETYFEEYAFCRERNVYLGIELGMDPAYEEIFRFSQLPFDYVLGSIHALDGENLYGNPALYGTAEKEFYRKYFHYAMRCLEKFSFVDAFAHFDYVTRYTPYEDPVLYYEGYREEYQQLFQLLLEKNILLEVNTKQIADRSNLKTVLTEYRRAGGRYVTLGSDAHSAEGMFRQFSMAEQLITEAGLKRACFIGRRLVELEG